MLKEGIPPMVPVLPIKLTTVPVAEAYEGLKLPDKWYNQLRKRAKERSGRQEVLLLSIKRLCAGTSVSQILHVGDVLLSLNGEPLLRPSDLHITTQEPVTLQILRNQEVMEVVVEPTCLDSFGTSRVIVWAGALLQDPYLAVRFYGQSPDSGIYVSGTYHGSPAEK